MSQPETKAPHFTDKETEGQRGHMTLFGPLEQEQVAHLSPKQGPVCGALDCYLFGRLVMTAPHLLAPTRGGALGWNFLFSEGSGGCPSRLTPLPPAAVPGCSRPGLPPLLAGPAPGLSRSGLAGCEVEALRDSVGPTPGAQRPEVRAPRPRPRPGPRPVPLAMGLALAPGR